MREFHIFVFSCGLLTDIPVPIVQVKQHVYE